MSIDISFNEADIRRISAKFKDIGSKKQQSAMASAITKVARAYRKDMIRRIKNRYTITGISTGDKTAPLKRASPSNLVATVTFPWAQKHTGYFKTKKNSGKSAAQAAIFGGNFKPISSPSGAKGFIPASRIGQVRARTVFYRMPAKSGRAKRKEVIWPTFGPSLRGMAHAEPVLEAALNTAQKDLVEKLDETVKKWL